MRKGRVIIDFESDDEGNCNWNIQQESDEELDNDNLVSLFEYILGDLLADQF